MNDNAQKNEREDVRSIKKPASRPAQMCQEPTLTEATNKGLRRGRMNGCYGLITDSYCVIIPASKDYFERGS